MLKDMMKQLRENRKLTKKQVADGIGINERAYITYEYGERDVSTDTLCKLADFYGVTTDYLLGREEKNETIKQLSAEFALTETEQKLLSNYIGLNDTQKDTFNKYVKEVAKQLINGVTAEIKQASTELPLKAASIPTEDQVLQMGDAQPRNLTDEDVKNVDFSQKPYFMTDN